VPANTPLFAICNHGSEPTAHAPEKRANDTRKWSPICGAHPPGLRAQPLLGKTFNPSNISFYRNKHPD
jgi:hypothetical protein